MNLWPIKVSKARAKCLKEQQPEKQVQPSLAQNQSQTERQARDRKRKAEAAKDPKFLAQRRQDMKL